MPKFDYYDLENHILINYYPFMTIFCQGGAFITGVLYSFTNYRLWNVWGTSMATLCLPVDCIIFYKEPLGTIGTLLFLVLGFVPFCIMIAVARILYKFIRFATAPIFLPFKIISSSPQTTLNSFRRKRKRKNRKRGRGGRNKERTY